ncbi:MAG: glycosyltransferase family 2 protein [Elusimicrobia bacterium]|nr:glycosyltransferase family 2 protein [Elusimicrobiota bacterium]
MANSNLTIIVLATNEEEDLPGCLESAKPLNGEIILVDGGSKDQTKEVAQRFGARVFERPFDNFTNQHAHSLTLANTAWILNLDADERLTLELCKEILQVITSEPLTLPSPPGGEGKNGGNFAAYRIPFKNYFMNHWMRFSGLGGEKILRLFQRGAARYRDDQSVHESLVIDGPVGSLKNPILHRPYKNLAEYMQKLETYTDLAAKDFAAQGKQLSWRHNFIPAWEFFHCYFLRLGFLDGFPGLIWAALSAYHRKVRYAKIKQTISRS